MKKTLNSVCNHFRTIWHVLHRGTLCCFFITIITGKGTIHHPIKVNKYGMFLLLTMGLAGALLVFACEHIAHKMQSKKGSIEIRNDRQVMERPEKRKRRAVALIETLAEIELAEPPKQSGKPT